MSESEQTSLLTPTYTTLVITLLLFIERIIRLGIELFGKTENLKCVCRSCCMRGKIVSQRKDKVEDTMHDRNIEEQESIVN